MSLFPQFPEIYNPKRTRVWSGNEKRKFKRLQVETQSAAATWMVF